MATTTGVNGAASTAPSSPSSAASSRTTIAQNFDAFLLLLTTQLKNQSPLDPLDTNQFTQQLVQFAGVEQQLKSNETLNALLANTKANTVSTAASFVGMQVTADGATTALAKGKAEWSLNASRGTQAAISITDKSGNVVWTETRTLTAGTQTYAWNGRTSTGGTAPDGEYTITVAAKETGTQGATIKTEISGAVTGVEMTGAEPVLQIGASRVPLAKVKSIVAKSS